MHPSEAKWSWHRPPPICERPTTRYSNYTARPSVATSPPVDDSLARTNLEVADSDALEVEGLQALQEIPYETPSLIFRVFGLRDDAIEQVATCALAGAKARCVTHEGRCPSEGSDNISQQSIYPAATSTAP